MNEDKERERRKRENKRTNELRQTIRTHYCTCIIMYYRERLGGWGPLGNPPILPPN